MNDELLAVSPRVARWLDPVHARLRILAALGFAVTVISLGDWRSALAALGVAGVLALAGGLGLAGVGRRLLAFEGFMLVLLVLLPFSIPGQAWFTLGPFQASIEGLHRALLVVLKANAVVLAALTLVGTLEPVRLGHALAGLGVPDKLVHLVLFTVRYLAVLEREYRRLRLAMRARGFVPRSNRHTWRSLGWLIGMLLLRTMERSRRIVDAMKCRGFQGRYYLADAERWCARDTWLALLAVPPPALLLVLDRLAQGRLV